MLSASAALRRPATMKPPPMEKKMRCVEHCACRVEGGEAHAVGMLRLAPAETSVAVEDQVVRFVEGNSVTAEQIDAPVRRGWRHGWRRWLRDRWCRLFADEAKQDGAIGSVAVAGEREGTVEST